MGRILCKYQVDAEYGSLYGLFLTTEAELELQLSQGLFRWYYGALGAHTEFRLDILPQHISILTKDNAILDLLETDILASLNLRVYRFNREMLTTILGYNPLNGNIVGHRLIRSSIIRNGWYTDWDLIPKSSIVLCLFYESCGGGMLQGMFITTKKNLAITQDLSSDWSGCLGKYDTVIAMHEKIQILTDDLEKIQTLYHAIKEGLDEVHHRLGISLYGNDPVDRIQCSSEFTDYEHECEDFLPLRKYFEAT